MRIRNLAPALLGLIGLFGYGPRSHAQQQRASPDAKPPAAHGAETARRFTIEDRFRYYERKTFMPSSVVAPALGAAFTEWATGIPSQWGQGPRGFGRRAVSGYSRQLISNTVGLGIGLADHEDPRHHATGQHGVWKRGLYAAREAVVSRKAGTVELMPAYSRIVGDYTAALVSNSWYPARASKADDVLWRGTTALASDVVWQEFREFWPDVRRTLQLHRRADHR